MDRIEEIGLFNPEWAVKIANFIECFPEFQPYRRIAPMTDKAISCGFWWEPKNLFEFCIYYPCAAGVNFNYAVQQYQIIVTFLRSGDWNTICQGLYNFLSTNNIQEKKKQIYWDIFCWIANYNLKPETLTIENVEVMKNEVKGLGSGFIGAVREQYSDSDRICQYTDIGYIKGFKKLYGSKDKIKEKSEMWMSMGFGRVANNFIFQIQRYA